MTDLLLGAVCGDVCGSAAEFNRVTHGPVNLFDEKNHFTDDSVLTFAVAKAIIDEYYKIDFDFAKYIKEFANKYPDAGYGAGFKSWAISKQQYISHSFGNGSAMRTSAIGYFAKDVVESRILAQKQASCSHNHNEGIRGAQTISEAIWWAYHEKNSVSYYKIDDILKTYYPNFADMTYEKLFEEYHNVFCVECQKSVPHALICFLNSTSYTDCITKAIALNGDTDTVAAMAGSIAYAYYKTIDPKILGFVKSRLPKEFIDISHKFDNLINGL